MNRAGRIRESIERVMLLLHAAGYRYTDHSSWLFLGHNRNGFVNNVFIDGTDGAEYEVELTDGPYNQHHSVRLSEIPGLLESWRVTT